MKTNVTFLLMVVLTALLSTSCHKDCICKYYKKDAMYDIKVWDDKHITEEDCNSMNDSYTLNIPLGDSGTEVEVVDFKVVCNQE